MRPYCFRVSGFPSEESQECSLPDLFSQLIMGSYCIVVSPMGCLLAKMVPPPTVACQLNTCRDPSACWTVRQGHSGSMVMLLQCLLHREWPAALGTGQLAVSCWRRRECGLRFASLETVIGLACETMARVGNRACREGQKTTQKALGVWLGWLRDEVSSSQTGVEKRL